MRTPRGLAAVALVPVLLATPATADTTDVVGGPRLATHGVVKAADTPALPATTAAGWLVADLDSGDVLAARDPHGRYAPASTLKALTALTLIPKLDPRRQVRPTFEDVNVEGSKVGLVDSVRYPIGQLFTAMMVVSGNDAANALATANGGLGKTLADMNAEARRIQAFDTRAATPNGLDAPGQTSSPYDLALIAREGLKLPAFREYVKTKRSQIRGPGGTTIAIATHNKLVWNYDGAIGVKNGYTSTARATFVGAATRGGRTLVVTLMKTNPRYWPEAAALLDWGFAAVAGDPTPVGQLVDPVPTVEQQAAQEPSPAPVRNAAATRLSADTRDGLPLLPAGIVASGVAVIGVSVLRTRSRRPKRMKLPPL